MPRIVSLLTILIAAALAVTAAAYDEGLFFSTHAVEALVVLWWLWVGVSIGSFLNVVAWRMPRGDSINGRSICPRCRFQLPARDNIPILSWLMLGGRCRNCRLPISIRYPIVESAVGLTITLIAVGELFQVTLPAQTASYQASPSQTLPWQGGGRFGSSLEIATMVVLLYHVLAVSISWAAGLIRLDGQRLPSSLIRFASVVLILPLLVYPPLMVVSWRMDALPAGQSDLNHLNAIVRVITSLVAAIFVARSLSRSLCPGADPKIDPLGKATARLMDLIFVLSVPTLIVGWQASMAVVMMSGILAAALRIFLPTVDALGRFAISMPVALTVQLLLWQWSLGCSYWPAVGAEPWPMIGWATAVMTIPLWLRDPPAH